MKLWSVGEKAVRKRRVGEGEMRSFMDLVGDLNPIHFDQEAAALAGFDRPIAHGMIVGSMFSEILGNELPGPGSIYLEQGFKFLAPVFFGDEVELIVEVLRVRPDNKIVTVRTSCTDSRGALLVDGEAVLLRRALDR